MRSSSGTEAGGGLAAFESTGQAAREASLGLIARSLGSVVSLEESHETPGIAPSNSSFLSLVCVNLSQAWSPPVATSGTHVHLE